MIGQSLLEQAILNQQTDCSINRDLCQPYRKEDPWLVLWYFDWEFFREWAMVLG